MWRSRVWKPVAESPTERTSGGGSEDDLATGPTVVFESCESFLSAPASLTFSCVCLYISSLCAEPYRAVPAEHGWRGCSAPRRRSRIYCRPRAGGGCRGGEGCVLDISRDRRRFSGLRPGLRPKSGVEPGHCQNSLLKTRAHRANPVRFENPAVFS